MRFFIPNISDVEKAEDFYNKVRDFTVRSCGFNVSQQRIYKISFRNGLDENLVEVGKADPFTGNLVFIIFDATAYLVCTLDRGIRSGPPLLVGKSDVLSVEVFQ